MSFPLTRLILTLAMVTPAVAATAWSCQAAAMAFWAGMTVPMVGLGRDMAADPIRALELKRQIQHHFLNFETYVPLADIVMLDPGEDTPTALLMQKACGRGRLFIWIPFKFKLPVMGEKVYEWCWKPQTKDA